MNNFGIFLFCHCDPAWAGEAILIFNLDCFVVISFLLAMTTIINSKFNFIYSCYIMPRRMLQKMRIHQDENLSR
ncbi:MAG: hypothetical protein ACD_80C00113G0020 [uncultured bacterium (gcode 4)]|uniref:Uncharacterized protein n=1 Tax=uncultured bacterium (gcode 4) TaxID=1234023 RepID=K1XIY8_9BACT|nr:MAG: hypothetical protein ACD_80C00113G0020 [uncultured bacterium (gcode 4)]